MTGPRWDDEMKFELLRLRSEMRADNFRVLATPLGIGRIRVESKSQQKPLYPALRVPLPVRPIGAAYAEAQQETTAAVSALPPQMPHVAQQTARHPPSTASIWMRWLLVHLLDLGFVSLCLGMGLVMLGFILDPTNMSWQPAHLAQAIPVQVLQKLHGWTLIVGVYLIFGLYWLFFKLVSGSTLGESFMPKFRASGDQAAAAPDKVSRET